MNLLASSALGFLSATNVSAHAMPTSSSAASMILYQPKVVMESPVDKFVNQARKIPDPILWTFLALGIPGWYFTSQIMASWIADDNAEQYNDEE